MKIIEFFKTNIKDFLLAMAIISLSLLIYEKPTYKINKIREESKKVTATSDLKETDNGLLNSEDEDLEKLKPLTIFKEEAPPATTELKLPTFKEVLFNEGNGKIKLVAITGTGSERKALIIDHMNNLRILKKGEVIEENLRVTSITDTTVKFKSQNRTKELSLYRSTDISENRIKSEIPRAAPHDPTIMRPHQPQEDIVLEPENIENQRPDRFIKPRRENIR